MKNNRNEAGFSILELVVYVACLGIIISIAVPKFSTMLATANTGKIQADLQTLDAAITMYQLDKGQTPRDIATDLDEYIAHLDKLQPPKGKCFVKGELTEIANSKYELASSKEEAVLDGHVLTEFVKASKLPNKETSMSGEQ